MAPEEDQAEVRRLFGEFLNGGQIQSFQVLLNRLLARTVLRPSHSGLRLIRNRNDPSRCTLGGPGRAASPEPLPLRDGRYLHVNMSVRKTRTPHGQRWKVYESRVQYQLDREMASDAWVFRYDYLREPRGAQPAAHLNVNATPGVGLDSLPNRSFHGFHFPTRRVSLERVICLLADDFGVPCATERTAWYPTLRLADDLFRQIAHDPQA